MPGMDLAREAALTDIVQLAVKNSPASIECSQKRLKSESSLFSLQTRHAVAFRICKGQGSLDSEHSSASRSCKAAWYASSTSSGTSTRRRPKATASSPRHCLEGAVFAACKDKVFNSQTTYLVGLRHFQSKPNGAERCTKRAFLFVSFKATYFCRDIRFSCEQHCNPLAHVAKTFTAGLHFHCKLLTVEGCLREGRRCGPAQPTEQNMAKAA